MYLLASSVSGIVDLALLALFLGFAVFGLIKGFWKQMIGFISWITALVVAYLLCKPIANLIFEKTPLGATLTEWLANKIGAEWNVEVPVEKLTEFLTAQNWPAFLANAVISAVEKLEAVQVNFAEIASQTIVQYVLVAISFLLLSVICKLIFMLVEKLFSFIIKHSPLKILDRILGLALCVVKCFLTLSLIVFIMELVSIDSLEGVKEVMNDSVIISFMSKYNPYSWLIGLLFK